MEEIKRFKKQELNKEDHRGIEKGAKVVKRVFGSAIGVVSLYVNRDKVKALGKNLVDGVKKLKR